MGKLLTHPLTPLLFFTAALAALLSTYLVVGLSPSPTFEIAASFFWSLLIAFWIVADARRRKCVPCFDFGFFCYVFLPITFLWYCLWSRGPRGVLTLAAFAALWLVPYLVASVVWIALYG